MEVSDLELIQKELEPSKRTSSSSAYILHYQPETREFVMSYLTSGGGGRVLLRLSEDGEKLKVIKTVKGNFNINDHPDSLTPDVESDSIPTKHLPTKH
jgi:hypothetical protein